MSSRRAVLVMCAPLLLSALGACDAGAKPEPRPAPTSCAALMPRIRAAVVAYDANAGMLIDHAMPKVLASCLDDAWPSELRECIARTTAKALLDHACDHLVPSELRAKVGKRFGLAPSQVSSMLDP